GDNEDIRAKGASLATDQDFGAGDLPSTGIRVEPFDICVSQQLDVRVSRKRRIDTSDLGIRLAVGETGIAVERIAPQQRRMRKGAALAVLFDQGTERQM